MQYLSHWAALRFWKVPYLKSIFKFEMQQVHFSEYTAFSREDRYPNKGRLVHLWSTPVPDNWKIRLKGIAVVAPELAYVQLAAQLDNIKLILLGMLMCALPNETGQKPVTNKQRMIRRIGTLPNVKGKAKALLALQYVEDQCRSPLEALLHMILSLPHSLGGYHLTGFIFNHEIIYCPENAKSVGKKNGFADLFHRLMNLILEYDSKEFHSDPESLAYDAKRTTAMIREGYDIYHIRTEQFYDEEKFVIYMHNVADKLGVRVRIRNKSFKRMNARIRSLFPRLKFLGTPPLKR
ncbi:MAG: hypothetical protein Q4G11_05370 [Gallicola sp.]|nr:hypothetical protein [Gallicola sp.]